MVVKLANLAALFYNRTVGILIYLIMGLPVLVNIALIVHVIKTGRDRSWIYIIFFLPLAGALVYFFVEILPALLGHPRVKETGRSLFRRLNAGGRLRRLERELELSPTFANRRRLADECLFQGDYQGAIRHYEDCLAGFDADNQEVTFALARCFFETEQHDRALDTLKKLKDAAGLFKKYDIDLLWARILEKSGKTEEAGVAYAAIAPQYPGFEGYARYGLYLKNTGRNREAYAQFDIILHLLKTLPRVNRRAEGVWIRTARLERARLRKTD